MNHCVMNSLYVHVYATGFICVMLVHYSDMYYFCGCINRVLGVQISFKTVLMLASRPINLNNNIVGYVCPICASSVALIM